MADLQKNDHLAEKQAFLNDYLPHDAGWQKQRIARRHITAGVVVFALVGCTALWAVPRILAVTGTSTPTPEEPMTTDLSVLGPRDVMVYERSPFLWTLVVIAYRVAGLGFAALGTYSSCKAYNDDGGVINGALCVTGAVTTAVTIGGATYSYLAKKAAEAGDIAASGVELGTLGNPAKKRSAFNTSPPSLANFAADWNARLEPSPLGHQIHGYLHRDNAHSGHLVPEGHDAWPVYEFTNEGGFKMHHMTYKHSNGNIVNRIGYANPSMHKRDSFNNEYFTSGGVDFYACDGPEGQNFNEGDSLGVEDEIQCAFGSLDDVSAFDYEIRDTDDSQTVGSGQVAPVGSDGATNLRFNDQCPSGIATDDDPTRLRQQAVQWCPKGYEEKAYHERLDEFFF